MRRLPLDIVVKHALCRVLIFSHLLWVLSATGAWAGGQKVESDYGRYQGSSTHKTMGPHQVGSPEAGPKDPIPYSLFKGERPTLTVRLSESNDSKPSYKVSIESLFPNQDPHLPHKLLAHTANSSRSQSVMHIESRRVGHRDLLQFVFKV